MKKEKKKLIVYNETVCFTDHPPSTEQVTSEYPTTVTQKSGKNVPVVQAYAYSKYLGRLIVEFDDEGNVINASGNTQLLDHQVKKGKRQFALSVHRALTYIFYSIEFS